VVESDSGRVWIIDGVREYVNFMIATEPRRKFRHVSAVSAVTIVIMNDECNSKAILRGNRG
jgi:hypothetical protein